eukprot:scaffold95865_cov75-Phaeocystis_antarctica.AAC.2
MTRRRPQSRGDYLRRASRSLRPEAAYYRGPRVVVVRGERELINRGTTQARLRRVGHVNSPRDTTEPPNACTTLPSGHPKA